MSAEEGRVPAHVRLARSARNSLAYSLAAGFTFVPYATLTDGDYFSVRSDSISEHSPMAAAQLLTFSVPLKYPASMGAATAAALPIPSSSADVRFAPNAEYALAKPHDGAPASLHSAIYRDAPLARARLSAGGPLATTAQSNALAESDTPSPCSEDPTDFLDSTPAALQNVLDCIAISSTPIPAMDAETSEEPEPLFQAEEAIEDVQTDRPATPSSGEHQTFASQPPASPEALSGNEEPHPEPADIFASQLERHAHEGLPSDMSARAQELLARYVAPPPMPPIRRSERSIAPDKTVAAAAPASHPEHTNQELIEATLPTPSEPLTASLSQGIGATDTAPPAPIAATVAISGNEVAGAGALAVSTETSQTLTSQSVTQLEDLSSNVEPNPEPAKLLETHSKIGAHEGLLSESLAPDQELLAYSLETPPLSPITGSEGMIAPGKQADTEAPLSYLKNSTPEHAEATAEAGSLQLLSDVSFDLKSIDSPGDHFKLIKPLQLGDTNAGMLPIYISTNGRIFVQLKELLELLRDSWSPSHYEHLAKSVSAGQFVTFDQLRRFDIDLRYDAANDKISIK